MRITREETIVQLTLMPRLFPVNCYLVEEEREWILVDAAMPFAAKAIANAVREAGKPLTRIVLTHAHADHVGALDRLKRSFPQAQVYISARDARLLAGDRTLDQDEPQDPIRGGFDKNLSTKPDVLLHDGDRVGSLLALSAPGHTPGMMAFLDTRTRALIAGDAFQTRGGIAVAGQVRPMFPFPAWGTWSKVRALASARKLRKANPALLAVGHGRMLRDPGELMDRAIAEAERQLLREG